MRIRDQITKLLYQGPGYIDWIRRITGLCLLAILPLEVFNTFLHGPYHVPAWRIGKMFFAAPEPAKWISILVWSLYAIACIALAAGVKKRLIPVFIFLVWLYYSTLEICIFHSSFVILMSLYLLAFAIDRRPFSLSRRIIQVGLSTCYFFSALHKFLHPEFIGGFTLHEMLGRGHLLRAEWQPFVQSLNLPWWSTEYIGYLVIALEFFLAFGFWFKATKKWALAAGVFLHAVLSLAIPGIDEFAIVAWTGYLAFFDRDVIPPNPDLSFKKPVLDMLVASLACYCCVAIPMRLFFVPPYEYIHMSLYDRVPWGFSMFLFNEEIKFVHVKYREADGKEHIIQLDGRMKEAASYNELIALAYYVARTHPDAVAVQVTSCTQINSHSTRIKRCVYLRAQDRIFMYQESVDGMSLRKRV